MASSVPQSLNLSILIQSPSSQRKAPAAATPLTPELPLLQRMLEAVGAVGVSKGAGACVRVSVFVGVGGLCPPLFFSHLCTQSRFPVFFAFLLCNIGIFSSALAAYTPHWFVHGVGVL